MKKALIILLTLFLLSCTTNTKSSETVKNQNPTEKDYKEYLEKNSSTIDLSDNTNKDLSLLDSDLQGKEIFLIGEFHATEVNYQVKMKFLKYFKEKTDFRYYLEEISYSQAYYFNKYLETGNEKILREIYKSTTGTYFSNESDYNHLKDLKKYNDSLPKNRKITVVGADIEHQTDIALKYLLDILPSKEIPKELQQTFTELKFINENWENSKVMIDRVTKFIEDVTVSSINNEELYKKYLGSEYFGFFHVLKNIKNKFEAYIYNSDDSLDRYNNIRDKMMAENFKSVKSTIQEGKYFGQWGLNHVFQSEEPNVKWFASYLNSEEFGFKGKILSLIFNYEN